MAGGWCSQNRNGPEDVVTYEAVNKFCSEGHSVNIGIPFARVFFHGGQCWPNGEDGPAHCGKANWTVGLA